MKVVESVQKGDELCFVKGISGSLGGGGSHHYGMKTSNNRAGKFSLILC